MSVLGQGHPAIFLECLSCSKADIRGAAVAKAECRRLPTFSLNPPQLLFPVETPAQYEGVKGWRQKLSHPVIMVKEMNPSIGREGYGIA